MDIEKFKKLEKVELGKPNQKYAKIGIILENAKEKIEYYNNLPSAKTYNDAYKEVLNARKGNSSLINEDGSVSKESLEIIDYALRKFRMGRQIGRRKEGMFLEKLSNKLNLDESKTILKKLRNLRIESNGWKDVKDDIQKLYNELSKGGSDSFDAKGKRFGVGASKIMNFLFPELFVMVDSNVANTLNQFGYIKIPRKGYTYYFSFEFYWEIMEICRKELEEYQKRHGNLQRLLDMDDKPTTLTRIFDKCAFVMAKKISHFN